MNTDSTNTPADFELHLQFAVPSERLFTALATLDGTKGWWTKFSEGFALLLCSALLLSAAALFNLAHPMPFGAGESISFVRGLSQ